MKNAKFTVEIEQQEDLTIVFALFKTHREDGSKMHEPKLLKSWEQDLPCTEDIMKEITLSDWSRWNTSLEKGQKVEISEAIYFDLLECLPPRDWKGHYFEVGEANHHEDGKAIHRACWKEGEQFFTGYPKQFKA